MTVLERLVRSPMVVALVVANVAVFAAQLASAEVATQLQLPGAIGSVVERPWTPVSVLFLHEVLPHLVVNAAVLVAFGVVLEPVVGAWRVAVAYLAAGVAGSVGILAVAATVGSEEPSAGASAAVIGIAGVVIGLRPDARLLGGTARQWLVTIVVVNLVLLVPLPLGSVAHLAGLGVGILYGRHLRQGVASRETGAPTGAPPVATG